LPLNYIKSTAYIYYHISEKMSSLF